MEFFAPVFINAIVNKTRNLQMPIVLITQRSCSLIRNDWGQTFW